MGSDPTIYRPWDLIPLFTDSEVLSHYLQTLKILFHCLQTLGFCLTIYRPWDFIPVFTDPEDFIPLFTNPGNLSHCLPALGILSHCLLVLGSYPIVYRPWDFIPMFTSPGILSHCHTHQIPCHSVSAVDSPVGWCSRHGNWTVPVQWFSHVVLGRGSQVL